MTALMLATSGGNLKLVKFLIDNGADVNAKNHAGISALNLASKKKNSELVNLLKARGAKE